MAHRTEGHRLLAATGKSPAEVARDTGRTIATVVRWFKRGKPDIDSAVILSERYGIPVPAWTRKLKRNGESKAA